MCLRHSQGKCEDHHCPQNLAVSRGRELSGLPARPLEQHVIAGLDSITADTCCTLSPAPWMPGGYPVIVIRLDRLPLLMAHFCSLPPVALGIPLWFTLSSLSPSCRCFPFIPTAAIASFGLGLATWACGILKILVFVGVIFSACRDEILA